MPETTPTPTHWVRIIRLAGFGLLAGCLAYLLIQSGLAWGYAYFLTHPICIAEATAIEGVEAPQEVKLSTKDGLSLDGWYYPPGNGAVVLALGGPCGALGKALPPVSFLLEDGFGVLQIDSRAHAQPRAAVTLGGNEPLDVQAGLKFLAGRPEVETIGAIGYSMGGVSAIRAASRFPQIQAVVAEGGFFNLGDDFIEPENAKSPLRSVFLYSIALSFWANSGLNPWQISPIDELGQISPRPVLLIYGEHEIESGHAQAQYKAAQEPKELWIVSGGAHGRNYAAAPKEYQRRVLDFFRENLLEQP